MNTTLSQLLGRSEQAVTTAISRLEEMTGLPAEDLRLLSESKEQLNKKKVQLGLDPYDTTSQELYHALLHRFDSDSRTIDRAVGVKDGADFNTRLNRAVKLVEHATGRPEIWSIKPSTARQLLRACPPKRLMKRLGYRSLESMLKRESITSLLLVAPFCESLTWREDFRKITTKLNSADYVMQPVSLIELSSTRYSGLKGPESSITISKLTGAVAIWPSAEVQKANCLTLSMMLAIGLEELDLKISLDSFFILHPALNWWTKTSHLLSVYHDDVVSLNLKDVALNHWRNTNYQSQSRQYGQQSFWDELKQRYQRYSQAVANTIPEVESELSGKPATESDVSMPMRLAAETVEA